MELKPDLASFLFVSAMAFAGGVIVFLLVILCGVPGLH